MTGDPRDVKADDLRYLAVIAESGRLVSAARALGVDHSTVSRRLQALEQALGVRVLNRASDGWELTEAGRAILEHARTVQRAVESASRYAAGTAVDPVGGTVRITAADGFGTLFVVPAVARVQEQHPSLRVELITGARELTLRSSSFDLAITIGATPATRFFSERLCEYDNAFFASERYLAEFGDPASLQELEHHRIIFFVEALQRMRELDLKHFVPDPVISFSSTNIFAQLAAVRQGLGIGLLSKFVAHGAPDIRPVAASIRPPRVPVTLVVRQEAADRPEIAVVREALHQEVRLRRDELVWRTAKA